MSVSVDLAAMAAQQGPKVVLLSGRVVSQGSGLPSSGTGNDYSGFDAAASLYIEAEARIREHSRGTPQLVLTVEGSADGLSWSTEETFTFTADGTQAATLDSPPAHLRVSWAATGNSEWQIVEVTAAPALLNAPGGGGGGSQPFDSVEIQAPAEGKVFDALLDTNADAEISMQMETLGGVRLDLSAGMGAAGYAKVSLADDDLDGNTIIATNGTSVIHGRTTAASSSQILGLGTITRENLRVLRDGVLVIRLHNAPADGDLGAGDCALWFDQTNGAPALNIKAKQANGTVVTGTIPLA